MPARHLVIVGPETIPYRVPPRRKRLVAGAHHNPIPVDWLRVRIADRPGWAPDVAAWRKEGDHWLGFVELQVLRGGQWFDQDDIRPD